MRTLGSRTVFAANTTSGRPFGTIDTPRQGATVSGVVTNFGWALTPQPKVIPADGSTIDVYIDGVMVGHPSYGHNRPDIAGLFPGYANSNGAVGFFQFDSRLLTNGRHTISWVVRDSAGAASGLGSRYFFVNNASELTLQPVAGLTTGGGIFHGSPRAWGLHSTTDTHSRDLVPTMGSHDAARTTANVRGLRMFTFSDRARYDEWRLTRAQIPL